MPTRDKHTKCWCGYSRDDCGNHGCPEYAHREFLIVAAHGTGNEPMAELWCETRGEIKFCPVCGKRL